MSLLRRAARRDEAEPAIIEALEAVLATVQQISGEGMPDLLVGYRGRTVLLEVKSAGGRLTPAQEAWLAWWCGSPVVVVTTPAEALAAVGARARVGPKRDPLGRP
jgi:hypothetical protein